MVTASSSSPDSTQQPHTEQRLRVWLSWSSGKDCSWALHTLRQQAGVHVVGLLTTLNGKANRVAMHAVRAQLLQQQAAATGLPVHQASACCVRARACVCLWLRLLCSRHVCARVPCMCPG
jgi:hypothetical protein